jgi:hypothetical protein
MVSQAVNKVLRMRLWDADVTVEPQRFGDLVEVVLGNVGQLKAEQKPRIVSLAGA